jgi:hypothetical protein
VFVIGQRVPESLIDAFVDKNANLWTREQKVLSFFERSDGGFTRDGRKSLQKIFERFSSFQVVKQSLHRHSRSAEHRSSAENSRIFDDDFHRTIVPRAWVQFWRRGALIFAHCDKPSHSNQREMRSRGR